MRKITTLLTIILLSCVICFFFIESGTAKTSTRKSVNLRTLINKMQKRFDEVLAFQADFIQETYSGATQLTSTGKGKLYLQKPRMMRWDYTEPEPQSFVTDRAKTWLYIPSEKKILLDDAKHFFDSPLVKSFLDGPKNLTKYFKVEVEKGVNYAGYILKLVPRNQKEQFDVEEIRLWVNNRQYQIETVETKDYLGNRNKVKLMNIKVVKELPTDLFTLIVPKGVIVERNVVNDSTPPNK